MKRSWQILASLAAIVCGTGIGRVLGNAGVASASAKQAEVSVAANYSRKQADGKNPEKAQPKNFYAIRKAHHEASEGFFSQQKEMERLSTPALKSLILELGGETSDGADRQRLAIVSAVAAELYRREGLGAAEWAASLAVGPARRRALSSVIQQAAGDDPVSAKPWIDLFEREYGKQERNIFAMAAMKGATLRGPEDIIRFCDVFGPETLKGMPIPQGELPADFDLAKLHAGLLGKVNLRSTIEVWAARDKEAAWQAVKDDLAQRGRPAGQYFDALITGAVAKEGEQEGMKWAMAKFNELSEDQRALCMGGFLSNFVSPTGLTAAASAMNDSDRQTFATTLINQTGGAENVLGVLELLPRDRLMQTLEAVAGQHAETLNGSNDGVFASRIRRLFQEAGSRYNLTPEEQARLAAASAK